MTLQHPTARPMTRRQLLWTGFAGLLGLSALSGCASQAGASSSGRTTALIRATMHKSPTCSCCGEYAAYLEANRFEIELVLDEDVARPKAAFGVPVAMWSCHTLQVGDYFVEGHVPLAAVEHLLRTRPDIDGIALPGMPAGSPGMPGRKAEVFVIYAVKDGQISEFMRI